MVELDSKLTHYLVVMQYYWGRGETRDAAFATMRKAGGSKKPKQYIVYRCGPKDYIDGMGALCWYGERPVEIERCGLPKK